MSNPSDDGDLIWNGIDATTGQPAFAPLPIADLANIVRLEMLGYTGHGGGDTPPPPDPVRGAADLAAEGWGLVLPVGLDPDVRAALEPLCAHRRSQTALYTELEFDPATDDFNAWLERHEVSPGNPDHTLVPKYLLLVGPPSLIPFEFQYLLGIEYGAGRLAFNTADEYAAYATSVVAYETAPAASTARELCFWGPKRDPATALSSADLLDPLLRGWGRARGVPEETRWPATCLLADQATRDALLDVLHRPEGKRPPAVLFTASHGAVWPSGHPQQAAEQGALLTQDWLPGDSVREKDRVAASDIRDDAGVHGLVAFLFACFSAATPAADSFPRRRDEATRAIAPAPFLSAFPQRLLAHPRGGALGVFGHVDRAFGYSIRRAGQAPQVQPFSRALNAILRGAPLGDALAGFVTRYAAFSASLLQGLDRGARPLTDRDLAQRWIERNDAQAYVLLGDPGASMRKDTAP